VVTKNIRNVFSRIGHVLETNLVDPRERYQATLLGDAIGRETYDAEDNFRGKLRKTHAVQDDRAVHRLNRAA
jgi:hypothetical protein